jgi:hypothetical protein
VWLIVRLFTFLRTYPPHTRPRLHEASLSAIGGVETDLKQGMKPFFEFKKGLAHDDPDIKFGVGLSWK